MRIGNERKIDRPKEASRSGGIGRLRRQNFPRSFLAFELPPRATLTTVTERFLRCALGTHSQQTADHSTPIPLIGGLYLSMVSWVADARRGAGSYVTAEERGNWHCLKRLYTAASADRNRSQRFVVCLP